MTHKCLWNTHTKIFLKQPFIYRKIIFFFEISRLLRLKKSFSMKIPCDSNDYTILNYSHNLAIYVLIVWNIYRIYIINNFESSISSKVTFWFKQREDPISYCEEK